MSKRHQTHRCHIVLITVCLDDMLDFWTKEGRTTSPSELAIIQQLYVKSQTRHRACDAEMYFYPYYH